MGVWDQIRQAVGALWTEWQGSNVDIQRQRLAWLAEACQTEQHLASQLRHIAPTVPYEHMQKRLEAMAADDAHHAYLLQHQIEAVENLSCAHQLATTASPNSTMGGPWRRLLGVLREKRELYERYRQEAVLLEEADLHVLLRRLRAEEAQHQEVLVDILTRLDAHVHDTIA